MASDTPATGTRLDVPSNISTNALPGSPGASRSPSPSGSQRNGIVVFSGGSAANSLVDVFENVRAANKSVLSYVIPISDNGGSTSEIIRVFGGPGIGDVRSRLVRLIPEDGPEKTATRHFFNHRLPKQYETAKSEFLAILEGTHDVWRGVSSPKKELIRSFLNHFHLEVIKRSRPSSKFDFSGASVGNIFLTGARLFTGSFEAAIYSLSSICSVPEDTSILPALNSNFAHHIAASLADGTIIIGQNDISHPNTPTAAVPLPALMNGESPRPLDDHIEDANLPGSHPALRRPAIDVSKDDDEDLPSRIDRLWYINPYGQEIRLPVNPRVLESLKDCSTVIYSIGSLFTSIIPNLVLRGVGESIASPWVRNKVLILNASLDRETGPSHHPFTALDFIAAIANSCAESRSLSRPGIESYSQYVNHVIYLESSTSPAVDRKLLSEIGIETVRIYGPKGEEGKGGRYDNVALAQTLEAIVGRSDRRPDRSRRNTLKT